MNVVEKSRKFISRWYLRYLMATELYMVEPWERAVIHILMALLFACFWYFNSTIVATGISQFRSARLSDQIEVL